MKKYPNVLIDFETDRKYGRDFVKGVARYARHFGPWTFYRDLPFYVRRGREERPDWDSFDGVIMRESPLMEEVIRRNIPLILCPYSYDCPEDVPHTLGDYETPAVMGAGHLLEKGLKSFAYCGYDGLPLSDKRKEAFVACLEDGGFRVSGYPCVRDSEYGGWEDEKARIVRWLRELPKPVGVMTCSDDRSRQLAEACRGTELKIPDDVVVIGVDNDELICELSVPRLSSVNLNSEAAGYDTAALLSRMMKGEAPDVMTIEARATGVVTRESSDMLAVGDPDLAQALRFIQSNAGRIIDVGDVVRATALSRRRLERRFRDFLDKSIYDEICLTRARRIARILRETDYPVSQIATDLGYPGEDHIARFFRKEMGMTPLAYRRSSRSSSYSNS